MCCFVFRRDRSAKKIVVLWALRRHTHIAASHSTPHEHTAHPAPVAPSDSHRGRSEGRKRQAAEGWQGADATSMAPPCAVSTTTAAHADAGALCAVRFQLQTRPVSKKGWALGFGATHAHRTARPMHILHIARWWSIDSFRMTTVHHRSDTPINSSSREAASAALVARAYSLLFFSTPIYRSRRFVRILFFQFPGILFQFQNHFFLFEFSQAVSNRFCLDDVICLWTQTQS